MFLKCTKDGSHQGRGVVTGLDEKEDNKFTVEVTGGEFTWAKPWISTAARIMHSASRIGRGTVGRTKTVAVNAEGSVQKCTSRRATRWSAASCCLKHVTGTLDGLYAPDKQVVSDTAGVIATVDAGNGTSVEKDAKIATIYPNDAMQIKMVISRRI